MAKIDRSTEQNMSNMQSGACDRRWQQEFEIIDISLPISSKTACFPGDVPFSRSILADTTKGDGCNNASMQMSPHLGTHTDSPLHMKGGYASKELAVGEIPMAPFMGSCLVVDVSPLVSEILPKHFEKMLKDLDKLPSRVLFRTRKVVRPHIFEDEYASISLAAVETLSKMNVSLVGIDTPSVDKIESVYLEVHNALLAHEMYWLENLDLTKAETGAYTLIALPLKLMELEASPVRAVLLK